MGALTHLTALGNRDIAVDLGTANTVVYVRGRGVVATEPSVTADASGAIVRPLAHGAIADLGLAKRMLGEFIGAIHQGRLGHPRIAVCVPCGVTATQRREIERVCLAAGASEARLIGKPLASALGAGLPVGDTPGTVIADLGAGTTEAAVISRGEIVVSRSIRTGGDALDEAIAVHCERAHGLVIEPATAEEVKLAAASATRLAEVVEVEVRGREPGPSGTEKTANLSSIEVREAIERPLREIVAAVRETVEGAPPDTTTDIINRGITLAGGGSLLQGFEQRLADECQMPVQVAKSPLTCAAVGSGISLEELPQTSNPSPTRASGSDPTHVSQAASPP